MLADPPHHRRLFIDFFQHERGISAFANGVRFNLDLRGFDAELVRVPVLVEQARIPDGPHREHVTYGVKNSPDVHRLAGIVVQPQADDLRVTLDAEDDWALLEALVRELTARHGDGPFAWRDVVALLRSRPDLVALNAHVEQKKVAG